MVPDKLVRIERRIGPNSCFIQEEDVGSTGLLAKPGCSPFDLELRFRLAQVEIFISPILPLAVPHVVDAK
jgi:hypothetical protein